MNASDFWSGVAVGALTGWLIGQILIFYRSMRRRKRSKSPEWVRNALKNKEK